MYIASYIPPPIEIPGNVAEAKWTEKLIFLRKHHAWSICLLAYIWIAGTILSRIILSLKFEAFVIVGLIVLLSLVRNFTRNSIWDGRLSIPIFLVLGLFIGIGASSEYLKSWPIFLAWSGIFGAAIYSVLCGKDFSFLGQFFLSFIASSVFIAFYCLSRNSSVFLVEKALFMNGISLFYFCYDTASIMSRRRANETFLSSIDLFRDSFNFVGFSIRCLRHWKRHKVFAI